MKIVGSGYVPYRRHGTCLYWIAIPYPTELLENRFPDSRRRPGKLLFIRYALLLNVVDFIWQLFYNAKRNGSPTLVPSTYGYLPNESEARFILRALIWGLRFVKVVFNIYTLVGG